MVGDHAATRFLATIIIIHLVAQFLSSSVTAGFGMVRCDRPDYCDFFVGCGNVINSTTWMQTPNGTVCQKLVAAVAPDLEYETRAEALAAAGTEYGLEFAFTIYNFMRVMPMWIPLLIANSYAHKPWAVRTAAPEIAPRPLARAD